MPVVLTFVALAALSGAAPNPEQSERIAATWDAVFAVPVERTWQLGAKIGVAYPEQSYGGHQRQLELGLVARRSLTPLLGAWAEGRSTFSDEGTLQLSYSKQRFGVLVGGGILTWQGRFCLRLGPHLALDMQRFALADGRRTFSAMRSELTVGASGAAGVAIAGRAVLSMGVAVDAARLETIDPHVFVEAAVSF